jgi:hypothetical protein
MPLRIVGTDFTNGDELVMELSNGQVVVYSLEQLVALEPILTVNKDARYPPQAAE